MLDDLGVIGELWAIDSGGGGAGPDKWGGATAASSNDIAVSDPTHWLDPALRSSLGLSSHSSATTSSPPPTLSLTSPSSTSSTTSHSRSSSLSAPKPPFTDLPSAPNCWALVLARSAASADAFVYCVTTTRIYCRPTCPSRRPNYTNVVFFKTGAEAVAAGYRACLRCKPQEASDPTERRQKEAVEKAKEVIRERVRNGGKIGLEELSTEVGMSAFHLHRLFKKQEGVTPEMFGKTVKEGLGGGEPQGKKAVKKLARGELSLVAREMVSSALMDLDSPAVRCSSLL